MAAVTHAGATWNTTAGNKTVTATPAVGDLIVVVAGTSGLAGGTTAVTDNQGGTYVQVDQDRTGFSTTGVLTVWIRNSLIESAVSTIFTASQGGSTGGGLSVERVSGMSIVGRDAVRRIGVATWNTGGQSTGTAGTTPAPVLGATPLTANTIISAICNGASAAGIVVQRATYTEDFDNAYTTPNTGLEVNHLNSGETSATITYGGTSATAFASVALELDTSVPQFDWVVPGGKRDRIVFLQKIKVPPTRTFLNPPTVLAEEPLARPTQVSTHSAVFVGQSAGRLYQRPTSQLFAPTVVNDPPAPPAPDEVLPVNLAPVIGGYGAM